MLFLTAAHSRAAERSAGLAAFPMLSAMARVISWIVSSSHPAVPRYWILLSLLIGAMSLQCALERAVQVGPTAASVWSLCLWTMPAVVSNVMAGGDAIGIVVTTILPRCLGNTGCIGVWRGGATPTQSPATLLPYAHARCRRIAPAPWRAGCRAGGCAPMVKPMAPWHWWPREHTRW